ncbi:hypothetical protein BP00DRAFT_430465 [Aspergillus indologenus CBS 114.80]|uniref:Uncharacterized protein n=1 Tax=Aspergillus indologenus CBS 114.80 TaxID=1450541 RepID=A0A2V5IQR0_9EURO|nr:hypothetical protein BP00DRAFT_430465 [Aspergillus indologenus CBS 114.80]
MSPGFSADLSPVELIEEYSRMLPSATTTLNHDYDYPPPPSSKQRDWKPYPLRSAYISSLLVLEIATVLTLSILLAISESRNGLLSVQHLLGPDKGPGGMLRNLWSAAYLWTTLPNAFFTLSRDLWASVVDAASKQQPYVELRKGNTLKNSLLLDYSSKPFLWSWYLAIRNKHYILGVIMLLYLVSNITVVPLSAHLLTATPVINNSTNTLKTLQLWDDLDLDDSLNWNEIVDEVFAMLIFKAPPSAWTDLHYAFRPYGADNVQVPSNITTYNLAVSGHLDCTIYTEENSTLNYIPYNDESGTLAVGIDDTGCNITYSMTLDSSAYYYIRSLSARECTANAGYSRIAIISGIRDLNSPFRIADYSAVSCTPTYRKTHGDLVTRFPDKYNSSVIYFQDHPSQSVEFRPATWDRFEQNLTSISFKDPTGALSVDGFSYLINRHVLEANTLNPYANKDQVLLSTERVFEAIYAVANDGLGFPRSVVANDEPPSIQGIVSTPDTRLFVVPETAYYIIVILSFIAVCNIILYYYHRRHRSVLWEEPVGLLGAAELLYEGNTSRFIARVRRHHPAATRIVKLALNDPAYALYTAAVDERGKPMVSASGRDLDDMMWDYKPASGYSV